MEIQDEVNLLVSGAINNLNIDSQIADVMDPKILLIDSRLTVEVDSLTGKINSNESSISGLLSRIELAEVDINDLRNRLDNIESRFFIDQNGNVQVGMLTYRRSRL
jgi:hypothetical protein